MRGFVVVYRCDGSSVDKSTVERIAEPQSHRGPDGSGTWVGDSVGVHQQTLYTTPDPRQHAQPNVRNGNVLVGDYRIDNRRELLEKLKELENPVTDGELILAAYDQWGDLCPKYLIGAFAFVIVDTERDRLFCVRDHAGIRPFHFGQTTNVFIAASESKSVLAHPTVSNELDEVRIGDYLVEMPEDPRRTFYSDVSRLPRATSAIVNRAGMRERKYWTLDPARELPLASDEAYISRFDQLFRQAVSCRLRTRNIPGFEVSGGLDSSSVACVADESRDWLSIPTFSVSYGDEQADESDSIEAVIGAGNFDPHSVLHKSAPAEGPRSCRRGHEG